MIDADDLTTTNDHRQYWTDSAQPPAAIRRLIALINAGYRIREEDFAYADDCVSLEHPAHWQKVKEKSLYLYDDGCVMGGPRSDQTCLLIQPTDGAQFQRLIAATPRPTWWERNNGPFHVVWTWVLIGAVIFAFVKVLNFVEGALLGK